jgi:hypothetical protein
MPKKLDSGPAETTDTTVITVPVTFVTYGHFKKWFCEVQLLCEDTTHVEGVKRADEIKYPCSLRVSVRDGGVDVKRFDVTLVVHGSLSHTTVNIKMVVVCV